MSSIVALAFCISGGSTLYIETGLKNPVSAGKFNRDDPEANKGSLQVG